MPKVNILFFILLFSVIFAGFVAAQPPPAAKKSGDVNKVYQEPSLNSLSSADRFSSTDGRFTISLPSNINGFSAITPQISGGEMSGSQYQWKFKEGIILAAYGDFLKESFIVKTEQDYVNYFAGAKDGILNKLNAKPVSISKINLGDFRGITMNFEMADGRKGVHRNYLVNKRQYTLLAIFSKDAPDAEKIINRAFDTLTLVSQSVVDEETRRKIEASTPAPLPQEPVSKREILDAKEDNLKGKVKTVVEESEDLSGTWSIQGRHRNSVTDFNEQGDRIKRLDYDSKANPFEVTVYGYIDGKRVLNSSIIRFENNPPSIMAITTNRQEKSKPDPRYEMRFEYKYLDGKLAEKKWVRNDGSMWMNYTYNYKGNQVEEIVYDENNKINQKYLSTLDGKGNEVEKTKVAIMEYQKAEGDSRYIIKYYSFDEQGNWTKKTTSKLTMENGKEILKPVYTDYRTITYFQ